MAMNKAEKARMGQLETDLAKAKALRWPDYVPTRIDVGAATKELGFNEFAEGWYFNAYGCRVEPGGFTRHRHYRGESQSGSCSQGSGGPWFATERDALMALRIELTDQFATILADIDRRIAEAA